jgi:outer membrane autotransporter protein
MCAISKSFTRNIRINIRSIEKLLLIVQIILWSIDPVNAQTLDEAVRFQLQNFCEVFRQETPVTQQIPNVGPNLNVLCPTRLGPPAPGPVGSSSSSGGGGATAQRQFLAVALQERLRRLHEGGKNGKAAGASADISEDLGNGFSAFFSGDYGSLNKNVTPYEDGYKSNRWGITLGGDYKINDWSLAGMAFNYNRSDGNFNTGEGFQNDSYGPTIYASFFPHQAFFIDVVASYLRMDFDRSRHVSFIDTAPIPSVSVNGTSSAKYNGDNFMASLLAGYDYHIASYTLGPRLGVNYSALRVNGFSETGNTGLELKQSSYGISSIQNVIGLQGSSSISTGFGVIVPQINADWIHEFANSQRDISVQFAQDFRANPSRFSYQTEKPVRNWVNFGAGIVMELPHGLQAYAQYRTLFGNSRFDSHVGSIGVRAEF